MVDRSRMKLLIIFFLQVLAVGAEDDNFLPSSWCEKQLLCLAANCSSGGNVSSELRPVTTIDFGCSAIMQIQLIDHDRLLIRARLPSQKDAASDRPREMKIDFAKQKIWCRANETFGNEVTPKIEDSQFGEDFSYCRFTVDADEINTDTLQFMSAGDGASEESHFAVNEKDKIHERIAKLEKTPRHAVYSNKRVNVSLCGASADVRCYSDESCSASDDDAPESASMAPFDSNSANVSTCALTIIHRNDSSGEDGMRAIEFQTPYEKPIVISMFIDHTVQFDPATDTISCTPACVVMEHEEEEEHRRFKREADKKRKKRRVNMYYKSGSVKMSDSDFDTMMSYKQAGSENKGEGTNWTSIILYGGIIFGLALALAIAAIGVKSYRTNKRGERLENQIHGSGESGTPRARTTPTFDYLKLKQESDVEPSSSTSALE